MKLLFDENLSDRIIPEIQKRFPDSTHVKACQLQHTPDSLIWSFAAGRDYVIVSKDSDFRQRSLLYGAPPKLIFLKLGNCQTKEVVDLLANSFALIEAFGADPDAAILILP